ncbi:expressed unknown protein [Seminavis robusta]|uniref:Uncharacterized protein n=1 Tax=Seminavis robusta TaxID=568900 RepID=A0A9N8ELR1_9STRA|nr:expressed unknown protein [Seminavis robusta]|eukprot:Sro1189_g250660.1 n/a (132) ;mRNA; r:1149-1632
MEMINSLVRLGVKTRWMWLWDAGYSRDGFPPAWIVFSSPYFYDSDSMKSYGLATSSNEDARWSDFLWWILQALLYAEEMGISSETYEEMPPVGLFVEDLIPMFQNAVRAVSSYGDTTTAPWKRPASVWKRQ